MKNSNVEEQARIEHNKNVLANVLETLLGCNSILNEFVKRSTAIGDGEILACWSEIYYWCRCRGGSEKLSFSTATETIQNTFSIPSNIDRQFAAMFINAEPG